MGEKENAAWVYFNEVTIFLGNNKDPHYRNIVANMHKACKEFGCKTTLKINYIFFHLDYFE